jgi:formylglycine-generating enzyme required for sulfatase activity
VQLYLWKLPDGTDYEMVQVPHGFFLSGGELGETTPKHHSPTHAPSRSPMGYDYWIGRNDVTWKQYRAYCKATGEKEPKAPSFGASDDHPVVNVCGREAANYCKWAGLSVPREAEWEKAARGTDGRWYPWGNDFDGSKCRYNSAKGGDDDDDDEDAPKQDKSEAHTWPVGSLPGGASPFGALDMAGNVWQICQDPDQTYVANWVRRGGGWDTGALMCQSGRVAYGRAGGGSRVALPDHREFDDENRLDSMGFRAVRR